jgi:hypothetical protein
MSTLTPRDRKRVVVVSVLSLLAFAAVGFIRHNVARNTIDGVLIIGLILLILPNLPRKKSSDELDNNQ